MRRPVSGSGRLAPLDGGSSRRSGVMRLCSSEQPAHISLIRRRSRSIVSRAPASSGNRPCRPERYSDVSIDQEIEGAVTNRLTAGPSISANRPACGGLDAAASFDAATELANPRDHLALVDRLHLAVLHHDLAVDDDGVDAAARRRVDRKSTRLNSSHLVISYAVFCLKKKKKTRSNI